MRAKLAIPAIAGKTCSMDAIHFQAEVSKDRTIRIPDGVSVPAGPARGDKTKEQHSRTGDGVWKHPGEAVEAFVDRRAQKLLSAVEPDECLDDFVVILALVDLRAKLSPHLLRSSTRA